MTLPDVVKGQPHVAAHNDERHAINTIQDLIDSGEIGGGTSGGTGWSPIFAVVTDGSRRVFQIIDWQGGTGTKPSVTNQFVGALGIVSTAAAANDVRGSVGISGTAGNNGLNGWTPTLILVNDGLRRVLQITDWQGGTGTKPSVTNQFIGSSGIVSSAASAVDVRGPAGADGSASAAGNNGWTPVLSVVNDSARRVYQIVDWQGGTGTKPSTTNQFVGASGIVSSAAAAVDIRGPIGADGATGSTGLTGSTGSAGNTGWSPVLSVVNDGSRRVHQIVDWQGGTGSKPSTTNQFVGASGIVSTAAAAVDIRGSAGADGAAGSTGSTGTAGDTGWSPVLALVADGAREVYQIVDWQGGTGTKPSVTNQFVGATGIVSTAAAAVDVMGPTGNPGGGGPAVPSWAGTRTRFYNQNTAIYNLKKSNTRRWNKALGLAMAGTGSAKIAIIGDSISAYRIGAATNDHQHMYPLIARDTIQQLTAGVTFAGDGYVPAGHNGAILDSRWVINSGGSVTNDFIQITTTGGSATFTSAKAGTVVDIVTFSASPAMTYSIDGGTAVTITPSGTNVPQKTTITGLSNSTHTVTLTRTGSGTAYILGVSVTQTTGLVVHNIAQYGSTTANAQEGWTSTGAFQNVNYRENALKTLLPTPDLLILNLGINDANSGTTAATVSTNIQTILARWTCDKLIVCPPQPSTTSGITLTLWNSYASMYYDLADSLDIPLLDMYDIQGGFTVASANGVQSDNFHPEAMFQRDAGRALGMALIQ